jgi:hypothetical protein
MKPVVWVRSVNGRLHGGPAASDGVGDADAAVLGVEAGVGDGLGPAGDGDWATGWLELHAATTATTRTANLGRTFVERNMRARGYAANVRP